MRIPLASNLESRDGTVDQDAIVKNCIVEAKGDQAKVRKRPALSSYGLIRVGVAQALGFWDGGIVSVVDDYFGYGVPGIYTHSTTWNSADKDAQITLSGSDLVATYTNNASAGSVRSVASVSSGLWYFEVTVNTALGGSAQIGLANSSFDINTSPIDSTNSISWERGGNIYVNNVYLYGTSSNWVLNDVLGILLDADNRTIKFYKNNSLVATATSAYVPSGALYAVFGVSAAGSTSAVTANFGATAFTYTVPGLTTNALSPTTADLQFSMQESGANSPGGNLLMIKNREQAWTVNNAGTVAAITDVDYPGTYAVTLQSLSRSSTTATATTASDTNFQVGGSVTISGCTGGTAAAYNITATIASVTPSVTSVSSPVAVSITRSSTTATAVSNASSHGFLTGQTVTIEGANETAYNGDKVITVVDNRTFTFTVTVTAGAGPALTATGTPVISSWVDTSAGVNGVSNTAAALNTFSVLTPFGNSLSNGETITFTYPTQVAGAWVVSNRTATGFQFTTTGILTTFSFGPATFTRASPPTIVSMVRQNGENFILLTVSGTNNLDTQYNQKITISGCDQGEYNTTFDARKVSTTEILLLYYGPGSVDSPETPATGTITAAKKTITGASFTFAIATGSDTAAGTPVATGGRNTVPGIAYVDGYFNVMDIYGVIYSSKEDSPSTWDALEYTSAQLETGAGVALTRSQNYLVAFKEWSSEFFYNARNPVGSPFSPVDNGFTQTGCASGDSVASVDGAILFMSQARQKGRSVHVMQGITQEKVSTPDVERVLNADDLATVRAYGMKLDGHSLYLLTLGTSNITLVYDLSSGIWSQWSSLTIGSSKSVSSITRSGTTATVTCGVAHTLSDGDPVKISGASQSDYNGIFQISYVDSTSFKIEVANSPTTPATGTILAYPYTESYFKFTHYTNADGTDLVLHESNGYLYSVSSSVYQDDSVPVNMFIRTQRLDGGDSALKKMARVRLIGEKVSDTAMIRWSDDDSATFSAYRRVTLSDQQPELRRCGAFRRRSMEFRHVGNTAPRADSLEMDMGS